MRLGIGTYTYPWTIGGRKYALDEDRMPIVKLIERAGGMAGVSLVQICDQSGLEKLPDAELDAVCSRAGRHGLTIQPGTRGIEPERLTRFLEVATRVKGNLVRTILPMTGPGSTYPEAKAILREVLPAYESANVLLSIENHDQNLAADLRRFIEDIASPALGICLDTVNSYGAGEDSRRVLDTLVPVTNCFHAKDYTVTRLEYGLGFVITGAPAGEGMLNIPEILGRFARAGIDPDVILEQWPPLQSDIHATIALEEEWACRGVTYINACLDRKAQQ